MDMKIRVILTLIAFVSVTMTGFSLTAISFGNEPGQVGFRAPVGAEGFPEGPNSYRSCNGNLWLADSVNKRIIFLDSSGKLQKSVVVSELSEKSYISDFALQFEKGSDKPTAIWLADLVSLNIFKVSLDGKLLLKISGKNALIQADEVACDSDGRVYIGDMGSSKIVVYGQDGKELRRMKWNWTSFAVSDKNHSYTMGFDEGKGNLLNEYDSDGKLVSQTVLGENQMQNPRIWNIDKQGNLMISYVPPSGNPTAQVLYKYSADGKVIEKTPFTNPYYIYRYLIFDGDKIQIVKANYAKAPKTGISIVDLK